MNTEIMSFDEMSKVEGGITGWKALACLGSIGVAIIGAGSPATYVGIGGIAAFCIDWNGDGE